MSNDIARSLPKPTEDNPFVQLDYIFRRFSEDAGMRETSHCLNRYKLFCEEKYGKNRAIQIREIWDENAVLAFQAWIKTQRTYRDKRPLAYATKAALSDTLFCVIRYAFDGRYIDILPFKMPNGQRSRETTVRSAYPENEELAVLDAIAPVIRYAHRVVEPYVKTGLGGERRKGEALTEENLVFFFENTLNCVPCSPTQLYERYYFFSSEIVRRYGSVEKWYEHLGVAEIISAHLVIPFAYKLAWETGLNVESLLSLERDCFVSQHELTGMPCIVYYKERGKGDALFPVQLLEANLQSKQSSVVKNTINQILKLTENLVSSASDNDKNMLFLIQSKRNPNGRGTVTRLNVAHLSRWSKAFFTPNIKYRNPKKSEENINLSRFRPTFVTRLVMEGRDIFAISALLNHSDISTTFLYLDHHRLMPQFDEEMRRHLNRIKENSKKYKKVIPIALMSDGDEGQPYLASGFSFCKNPYNPPKNVRSASGFVPGKACTYYDMCLLCMHVLITEHSLPHLINYRWKLLLELEKGLGAEPRKNLYRRQLHVLDELLAPDEFFTADDIQKGAALAKQCVAEHFDDFLYD